MAIGDTSTAVLYYNTHSMYVCALWNFLFGKKGKVFEGKTFNNFLLSNSNAHSLYCNMTGTLMISSCSVEKRGGRRRRVNSLACSSWLLAIINGLSLGLG